jgi:hypothetical protein
MAVGREIERRDSSLAYQPRTRVYGMKKGVLHDAQFWIRGAEQ